jgi:translation initiation factor IF-2
MVYKQALIAKRNAGYRFKKSVAHSRESEEVVIDNEKNHILSIILRADVNGTLEAILNVLDTYNANDKVKIDIVNFGVGPLSKSDLEIAETFGSTIYCFNTPAVVGQTDAPKYKIKHFNIIYRMFDDIKEEIQRLAPLVETVDKIGEAELAQVFEIDDKKEVLQVAGGRCLDGLIDSRKYFKILRNDKVIYEKEKCKVLKHFKSVVVTLKKGSEFGFSFENKAIKIQAGDKIICYDIKMVPESIEWDFGF